MKAKKISRPQRPSKRIFPEDPFAVSPGADAMMLLALAAPTVRAPSPAVKGALLARIRTANAVPAVAAGWRFANVASDEGWVKLPLPGLRLREVTLDAARDTALLFIEMAPGAVFPDHDHTATERGLVLSGDLRMDGRLLVAGDFYEAAAGTRHERVASPSGCTGLLWVGAEAWQRWRAQAVAS